ncbi:MAG TPA: dephospho-CoA kinase [Telluria sp.]|nr:dephospho-CoA kinase [Telluria sp.]
MSAASAPAFAVGLTGGIGSGKSLVADLLAERGAAIVDTDAIAHALTAPHGAAIDAIAAAFGTGFVTPEGALDRARMRALVFTDRDAKRRLEAILHPLIRAEAEDRAARAAAPYVVFVVPLLVESGGWRQRVQRILVVDCPESVQIQRVMARNNMAEEQVRAILAAQASRAERLAAADDVIVNDGPVAALGPEVDRLHAKYLAFSENLGCIPMQRL